MPTQRVLLDHQPFDQDQPQQWTKRGLWPAQWISHPHFETPIVVAYKCEFRLEKPQKFVVHATGDERYDLFLDGERIGRGPERGDEENWFFESYEWDLAAGKHTVVARVWSAGEKAAFAQMSVAHGFLLCPEDESLIPILATGEANWQSKVLDGFEWHEALCAWGTGWNQTIRGADYSWNHESGAGEDWREPKIGPRGARVGSQQEVPKQHFLRPAMLPPMVDELKKIGKVRTVAEFENRPVGETPLCAADSLENEIADWQKLVAGENSLKIPAHCKRRVIVDLENYFCARPEFSVSGGKNARLEIDWSECPFEETEKWAKGDRDQIEGKFFTAHWNKKDGPGDNFTLDGGENRKFETLWWQTGRYVQILVETDKEPLEIQSFGLRETRYPLEMESKFSASDKSLESIIPIMVRGLQMCSHETYMDCPFYEQLMYVGDTRLEVLVTYAITRDEKLPRKALKIFDWSRLLSGLTQSRYPSQVRQIIPPFSMWWVAMCHDYALWRGDPEFTKSLLPGVRAVCEHFAGLVNQDGLLTAPDGWNFCDWVKTTEEQLKYEGGDPKWQGGTPPKGSWSISGIFNWQIAGIWRMASELEEWFGEPEIAELQMRRAKNVANAADKHFWDEKRGLYADDLAHENWSEHAQCLAIVSGLTPESRLAQLEKGLLEDPDLARTTIYFSHYLFETFRILGRMDAFFTRLKDWNELVENGLKTTIEMPEPTRSDCHAWGAHPLFHFYATLAGIRPTAPGFSHVEIKPQLGHLTSLEAIMPIPQGEIRVSIAGDRQEILVPEGVSLK